MILKIIYNISLLKRIIIINLYMKINCIMQKSKILFFIVIMLFACNVSAQDTLRLRVMTYNIRFGELATADQLAEHIKFFKPDFVALEEVDVNTNRSLALHQNGRNIISELAGKSNMFGLYGKAINFNKGYYGIAILSRYPYIHVNKLNLPNPQGTEPRVLLEALFEIGNADTIIFAATHLDVKDEKTRRLQAEYITDYFKKFSYPIIIGGDFNAKPDSGTIKGVMARNWFYATDSSLTFPAWEPKIKIDYIFARPEKGWRLINTQAVQSQLSDHSSVVTDLEYIRN